MAIATYQLVLGAAPKRLSDIYGDGAGVVDARHDIPYRQLFVQAEGADFYLGSTSAVATSAYGVKVLTAGSAIALGPFDTGPLKLSDFFAVGAGATLHVLGVPF